MRDYLNVFDGTIMVQTRSLFTVFLIATLANATAAGLSLSLSEARVGLVVFMARLLLSRYCTF